MYLEDELHVSYKLGNAEVNYFPFPHFYVENVFSHDFYKKIQLNLPDESYLFKISDKRQVPEGVYDERLILSLDDEDLKLLPNAEFWTLLKKQFLTGGLKNFLISKFKDYIRHTHPDIDSYKTYSEILIVKDKKNYALGPHTDSTKKILTLLFYMPEDNSDENLGTSIYIPKESKFRCLGGPHYDRSEFHRVYTFPFKKNSVFGFVKTDNSFHGVEKIDSVKNRWLLLYDIKYVI